MTRKNLCLVVLVALLAAPAFAAGAIRTEISMASPMLKHTQNVEVDFVMTNVSERSMRVLLWNTPFDGINGNLFEVARNGELVPYLGRVYKRGTPQAADYLLLAAGESRSVKVELSALYKMNWTGEYVIRFRNGDFDHSPSLTKGFGGELTDLSSNQIFFWMDGLEAPIHDEFTAGIVAQKAKPPKISCDNSQQAILADALAAAQGIAGNAASYLGSGSSNSQRYGEWFGAYSSGRWNTVESNFNAIDNALNNANVEFDCKCKQNYYAYVYPSEPYKIYLCKVFWTAPMTGTDSKAGTLVHEMSHFNVVAATDDVVYGQSGCRSLANSDPNDAIINADSHEYFAENTPSLP
jgi:peptidyl-Lys metalloendopeptidase